MTFDKETMSDLFVNESQNKFTDISSEEWRTYAFPNDNNVTINDPLLLSTSSGGHRIFDALGVSHYVPKGWIHLSWKARPARPNFVK